MTQAVRLAKNGKVLVGMTSARANTPAKGGGGGGSNSMLLELVDRILDKGIVIDAWARVSVLSIELLTIEARVVVASVDTYLRYAEAIGNTALASMPRPQSAQQGRTMPAGGQQQGQLGGQQAGGQQMQALPQPQQQNMMPQMPQRQGQQQQAQAQPQQAQPQQVQPQQIQHPQQAQQPQQAQPQQQSGQ